MKYLGLVIDNISKCFDKQLKQSKDNNNYIASFLQCDTKHFCAVQIC